MNIYSITLALILLGGCSNSGDSSSSSAQDRTIVDSLISDAHAGPVWEISDNLSKFIVCDPSAYATSQNSDGTVNVLFSTESEDNSYYSDVNTQENPETGDFYTYGTVLKFKKISSSLWQATGLNGVTINAIRYTPTASDYSFRVSFKVGVRSSVINSFGSCY